MKYSLNNISGCLQVLIEIRFLLNYILPTNSSVSLLLRECNGRDHSDPTGCLHRWTSCFDTFPFKIAICSSFWRLHLTLTNPKPNCNPQIYVRPILVHKFLVVRSTVQILVMLVGHGKFEQYTRWCTIVKQNLLVCTSEREWVCCEFESFCECFLCELKIPLSWLRIPRPSSI